MMMGRYNCYNSLAFTPAGVEGLIAGGLDKHRASPDGATPDTYGAFQHRILTVDSVSSCEDCNNHWSL